ncbi:MAG TPA: rhodanese-like domain-containing protein [Methylibium sp.]|nr:rhodanese-like domain-containing protein [Methylibium sp.]
MSFLLDNWYLVLTALVSGGVLLWPAFARSGGGGRVSAGEAVMLINREKAVLIDVGEPAEYAAGHAMPARNVPFGQLETSKELPSNKTLPVLLICPTGARAQRAVALVKKRGHERVHAITGGLAAWREAQLPVEKSAG